MAATTGFYLSEAEGPPHTSRVQYHRPCGEIVDVPELPLLPPLVQVDAVAYRFAGRIDGE